jgi:hypothetical protein
MHPKKTTTALIGTGKSASVYKSSPPGPKTGQGDNWHFIIRGWDLEEDTCTRCRLLRQVTKGAFRGITCKTVSG